MDIEVVGQCHSFGRDISDLLITVHHYRDIFYLCVAYYGDSVVLLYEVLFLNELADRQNDAKRRKHFDSTSKRYNYGNNYKFAFVKSHVLPFPIYFLLSAAGGIWVISQSVYTEITVIILESSCNTLVEFSVDKPMGLSSCEFVESKEHKRNSVCCVSEFSNGILVCHENVLQKCWIIEVIRRGKKPVLLFSIPFASSCIHVCSKSPKSCYSGSPKPCLPVKVANSSLMHTPVVSCIEMETEVNQGKRNVLKKDEFGAIFRCSVSSNATVLIGFPDGNVLWQFMNLSDSRSVDHEEREFHLLCNIEQPVSYINIVPHLGTTGEISSIIVIGAYGKVMILSPEVMNTPFPFAVSVSHIPSPVEEVLVCHQGLLHTSSDGQLWLSTLSDEKTISSNTLCSSHIILDTQQLNYCRVKHTVVLNHQKGIIMCVASDGNVHAGKFFRTRAVDQGISEEELPFILKSISMYGTQLQELQMLAQKQRRLFSALAAAANIKFQGSHEVSISCKIKEVLSDTKKFLIMMEFHNLKYFNLDHELWTLNGSVSSILEERITLSQGTPLNHVNCCLTIEANASLFADSAFPLLVEGGLLLDIPAEWKLLGCFENVVTNLPLYVRIAAVIINELCILRQSVSPKWSEASIIQFGQSRYKSVCTALQRIGEIKSSYIYFKTGQAIKDYSNCDLPQEFSFPIFVSSAQSILNDGVGSPVESVDLPEKMIQYLMRRSNITVLMSAGNFVCLNNPVTVSGRRNGSLVRVTVRCSSFSILAGLKMSFIHLLKEGNHIQSREKNISISFGLHRVLQALSTEISQLLCQQRNYVMQEDIEVYKKLRENISNNLHVL